MTKVLTVATPVQKAVFEAVLLPEISSGFWHNARPANHADSWKGVEVQVGTKLGVSGFEVPRNYNFVNPDFFRKMETRLMDAAKEVEPNITVKQLKKQLISLNQIIGARLTEVGGTITKLPRGRKQSFTGTTSTKSTNSNTIVKKVLANIVEPESVDTMESEPAVA